MVLGGAEWKNETRMRLRATGDDKTRQDKTRQDKAFVRASRVQGVRGIIGASCYCFLFLVMMVMMIIVMIMIMIDIIITMITMTIMITIAMIMMIILMMTRIDDCVDSLVFVIFSYLNK